MSRYIDADFAAVCDEWQSTATSGKIISEKVRCGYWEQRWTKRGKSMSRYIDADELIRKINEHECYSYDPEVSRICELINDAPTLDVEPVRHGRWIKHYECCDALVCSECGTPSIVAKKYCCVCGAKMDDKVRLK